MFWNNPPPHGGSRACTKHISTSVEKSKRNSVTVWYEVRRLRERIISETESGLVRITKR
jgi:hypothetical protein